MQYEQYVLLIIGVIVLIISIFNIVTIVLNMMSTYKEGFSLYDTIYNITSDVKLAIDQNRYDRSLLGNQDEIVKSYEETRANAEKEEYSKRDIDCDYTWSEYSNCDATCVGNTSGRAVGKQIKTLTVNTPSQKNGEPCPDKNVDEKSCSIPCDVDCVLDDRPFAGANSCDANRNCNGTSKNASGFKYLEYRINVAPKNNGKKCNNLRQNLTCTNNQLAGDKCVEQIPCTTNTCAVDCQGNWSGWSGCQYGACDKATGLKQPTTENSERIYTITRNKENSGQGCPFNHNHKETNKCERNVKCDVNCEGYWTVPNQTCPTIGYWMNTYNKTLDHKNNGNSSCPASGTLGNCPTTLSIYNKGLSIDNHCIQTKGEYGDYWGYPADNWNIIIWWHDPNNGSKCYKESRFRVNFLNDGRIQSVYRSGLYLVADEIESGSIVKWKLDGNAKWFVNKEGKIQLFSQNGINYSNNNLCLGYQNKHNNAGIHLRYCNLVSNIEIID